MQDKFIADQFKKINSTIFGKLQQISPFQAQLGFGCGADKWDRMPYEAGCFALQRQFKIKNTIPRYCFDCYKIEVFPENVLDFFKLLFVFEKIIFKKNNHRKLWLRPKKTIEVNYTGTFYFQSLEEAKSSLDFIKNYINDETSINMPMRLKRGCSNYLDKLPNFSDINENYDTLVDDKDSWQRIEKNFMTEYLKEPIQNPYTKNPKRKIDDFSIYEKNILYAWLGFAAIIGDESYKKITSIEPNVLKQFIPQVFYNVIL